LGISFDDKLDTLVAEMAFAIKENNFTHGCSSFSLFCKESS
jgi:hypothetical protein